MTTDDLISLVRSATEEDIVKALNGAAVTPPLSKPADLLEFFHCVIDVMLLVRDDEEAAESHRIPPGFGSTG